ncbi:MOSC domain-containing protein [Aquabacterium sp.]|uniref:MOSC domain-containing protein n=1 Tax=Aquabacterium sp. TaxID=1872578 RepID=UPI0035B4EF09
MPRRVARLLSINTARAAPLVIEGRRVMSGIGKRSASSLDAPERLAVKPLGIDGDEQVDACVHGGLSKAVYAYPSEHYPFWQTVRAQAQVAGWDEPLPHGMMGENLTLSGLLEGDVWVGDVLRFADCTLAVSEPRRPCYKFQHVMGFKHALKMMAQSGFSGFYLAVRVPGTLAAGESFELIPGPREVNIRELFLAKMRKDAAS